MDVDGFLADGTAGTDCAKCMCCRLRVYYAKTGDTFNSNAIAKGESNELCAGRLLHVNLIDLYINLKFVMQQSVSITLLCSGY